MPVVLKERKHWKDLGRMGANREGQGRQQSVGADPQATPGMNSGAQRAGWAGKWCQEQTSSPQKTLKRKELSHKPRGASGSQPTSAGPPRQLNPECTTVQRKTHDQLLCLPLLRGFLPSPGPRFSVPQSLAWPAVSTHLASVTLAGLPLHTSICT